MDAQTKLKKRLGETNSLLCVGLDSDFEKIPESFTKKSTPQFEFNKYIIELTHEYVLSYKINTAFYEAHGALGMQDLKLTLDYLNENHPDIFTICDAKRADIGNTNKGYVEEVFDWLNFDAVTLHPYLGSEALGPFLSRKDKFSIMLCRTSNPGAGEFQDLESDGWPLWKHVASKVNNNWNEHNNCMLVVGATYPEEMKQIRHVAPDLWFLVPGIGAQGGDLRATLGAGLNEQKEGLLIHSARNIIFASNPKAEAKKLFEKINHLREEID